MNKVGDLLLNDNGSAIGYLLTLFPDRGIFSPDGKVSIAKEEAEAHNGALAEAEILGLDAAEVGQSGVLYFSWRWHNAGGDRRNINTAPYRLHSEARVTTWTGTVVAEGVNVSVAGPFDHWNRLVTPTITFKRPNKHVFRGRLRRNADCFNFKRIR